MKKRGSKVIENSLLKNNPLWVVDIGASGGIDNRWRNLTSNFRAILFEPDPRAFHLLSSEREDNFIILNSALSDSAGEIDFHLCRKQRVSSVYFPNLEFLSKFPDAERYAVEKTIKLDSDTLDNQLKQNDITEVDFIKIDTQGYELPILKGSMNTLKKIIGLELEVEFAPLYQNQALFDKIDSFVREIGFELFDLKRYYWKRKNTDDYGYRKGQMVFGDALYFRSPEELLFIDGFNEDKIIRSICVYLSYGYTDLAETLLKISIDQGVISTKCASSIFSAISGFKANDILPNFRGKGRIHNLLVKVANAFSYKGWYSGTDKVIGNY